ncbi:MAG: ERCC4 domain-containing protein, partial [Nanoarchaeota archaeon]|nr:ERCC4 domain-containing protein [Nanoarchaeota archaeon]
MPFYNIFSRISKKSRKNKIIKEKPRIIADIHEKDSLILAELTEKQNNKEIELIIQSLKIGDYLIGNIIIERKTISDFISSMINKRLIEQLKQMQEYKQQLLIIEGDLEEFEDFNNPNALRGFILSIITNYLI